MVLVTIYDRYFRLDSLHTLYTNFLCYGIVLYKLHVSLKRSVTVRGLVLQSRCLCLYADYRFDPHIEGHDSMCDDRIKFIAV